MYFWPLKTTLPAKIDKESPKCTEPQYSLRVAVVTGLGLSPKICPFFTSSIALLLSAAYISYF